MSVYVVRVQAHGQAKPQFVGLYVTRSVAELETLVESCCSKYVCEFAEVPHSCMYGPDTAPASERLYEEKPDPAFTSFDDLSDDWRELFFGASKLEWRNLCAAPWRSEEARDQAFAEARQQLLAA